MRKELLKTTTPDELPTETEHGGLRKKDALSDKFKNLNIRSKFVQHPLYFTVI